MWDKNRLITKAHSRKAARSGKCITSLQITEKGSREGDSGELLRAMSWSRDEEPLPRQRYVKAKDAEVTRRMNVDNPINKGPLLWKINKESRKRKALSNSYRKQLPAEIEIHGTSASLRIAF